MDVLGQHYLVYDNGRQDRILLFGTDESFRFLSNAQDRFLDGTFKSSPVQSMQLHTVRGLTNHRNIVGAYALLPNKRRTLYVEMLTEVQRVTHNAMPHSLMTDFESSMLSALNQIYPDITSRMFISFCKECLYTCARHWITTELPYYLKEI